MVKAMIDIKEEANTILNIVKAKHGLKTKSEAIEKLAEEYEKILSFPVEKPALNVEEKISYSH